MGQTPEHMALVWVTQQRCAASNLVQVPGSIDEFICRLHSSTAAKRFWGFGKFYEDGFGASSPLRLSVAP